MDSCSLVKLRGGSSAGLLSWVDGELGLDTVRRWRKAGAEGREEAVSEPTTQPVPQHHPITLLLLPAAAPAAAWVRVGLSSLPSSRACRPAEVG